MITTGRLSRVARLARLAPAVLGGDAGAWFIHYATFTRTAQIGNIETGVFAGAICAMSFASLYILKEFKLETIFTA